MRRFLLPSREEKKRRFFALMLRIRGRKSLATSGFTGAFFRRQFIPKPRKSPSYRVTNPQPKEWWSYGSFPSGTQQGLYRYEQPSPTQQGTDLKSKAAVVTNAIVSRKLGLRPCGVVTDYPGKCRRYPCLCRGVDRDKGQLHSPRDLQTMSSPMLFSICATYCTLSKQTPFYTAFRVGFG